MLNTWCQVSAVLGGVGGEAGYKCLSMSCRLKKKKGKE